MSIRHECSGQSLEEESDGGGHASEVCAQTRAESEKAEQERDDGEEEGDQVEGKHESAQKVVPISADELLRDAGVCIEVLLAGRVEWERRMDWSAITIVAANNAAEGEESPARRVGDMSVCATCYAIGGGLEEVDLIQWGALHGAGQDDEELEDDAAGEEDEGDNGENGSYAWYD